MGFCRYGGDGGLIILTSRFPFSDLQRFLGKEFYHLDLEHLNPSDGAELLSACGVAGTALERQSITTLYDGHPLALRIFARIARSDERSPLTLARSILTDACSPEQSTGIRNDAKVRRLLDFYSSKMPHVQRIILASIALFLESTNEATIVDLVIGLDKNIASQGTAASILIKSQLDLLVLEGLVIKETEFSVANYSCHPIIKDYFRRTIATDKNQVQTIAQVLVPGSHEEDLTSSRPAATARDSNERGLVIAAIDLFTSVDDFEKADSLFSARLDNGAVFLETLDLHQGLECVQRFIGSNSRREFCERLLPQRRIAYYLHLAGLFSSAIGEIAQANAYYKFSYEASMLAGKTSTATFLPNLAHPLVLTGQLSRAQDWLNTVLQWALVMPRIFRHECIRALSSNAQILGLKGRLKEASSQFAIIWELGGFCSELQDVENRSQLISQGFDSSPTVKWSALMLRTGNHQPAHEVLTFIINNPVKSLNRRPDELARIEWLLGWCALNRGLSDVALAHVENAEATFRNSLWIEDLIEVLLLKTRIQMNRGDYNFAQISADEALELCAPREMRIFHSDALCLRARLALQADPLGAGLQRNRMERAYDDAKAAWHISVRCQYFWGRLDALSILSDVEGHIESPLPPHQHKLQYQALLDKREEFDFDDANQLIEQYKRPHHLWDS